MIPSGNLSLTIPGRVIRILLSIPLLILSGGTHNIAKIVDARFEIDFDCC